MVAFIGGIDLTDGRYDTPEFNLFKTLRTLHAGDFYQVWQQWKSVSQI
jgi:phospholipase D1/2